MTTELLATPSRSGWTPDRTHQQRIEALQRANGIRSGRADFKRDLRAGRKDLIGVIFNPPDWLHTAKVYELMLEVPKIGRVKANKALSHSQVSPSKTLGGLTTRQRLELVNALIEQIPAHRRPRQPVRSFAFS